MKAIIGVMTIAVAVTGAFAQDKSTVESVIRDQIAAFAAGDTAKAFSLASPSIQERFQTPEYFGRMVELGYPEIWSAETVRFSGLFQNDGNVTQRVEVTAQDGTQALYDYRMIDTRGHWRIDGVRPVKPAGPGV